MMIPQKSTSSSRKWHDDQIFLLQSARQGHHQQYISGAIASMVAFISGMHQSWVACVLPYLLSPDNPQHLTGSEASTLAVMGNFAVVPGIVGGWIICDKYGRKRALQVTVVPFLIAAIIYAISIDKYALYFSQIAAGVGGMATMVALPPYLTEISSAKIRGNLMSFLSFQLVFGNFVEYVLVSMVTFTVNAWIMVSLTVLMFILLCFLPESPYYLYMNNDPKLSGTLATLNLQGYDLDQMILAKENGKDHQYRDIFFLSTNRKALFLSILVMFCYCFSGRVAIAAYSMVIFKNYETLVPAATSGVIFSGTAIFGLVCCLVFFDSFNRKTILLVSSVLMLIILFIVGLFFALPPSPSAVVSLIPLVSLSFHRFVSSGVECFTFAVLSELFPMKLKSMAGSILTFMAAIFNTITVKVFQMVCDNAGMSYGFWIFCAFYGLGSVFVFLVVPETKGKGLEDIQVQLMRRRSFLGI